MKYFEVETPGSQGEPKPVRSQGDAVRAKLAELDLSEEAMSDAIAWARGSQNKPDANVNDE